MKRYKKITKFKKEENIKKNNEKQFNKKSVIIISLILAAIALFAFINVLKNEFVYDDNPIVVNNFTIRSLANPVKFFTQSYWNDKSLGLYRPVTILSFAIDYALYELKPAGYHFTNLLIHVINTILVFFITASYFRKNLFLSFAAALIFGLHPVHTEAVDAVYGRADLLSTLFFLVALFFYQRFVFSESRKPLYYLLSVIAFFIALLSKEAAITFIGVIFFQDLLFCQKKRNLFEWMKIYSGFIVSILLYFYMRLSVLGGLLICQSIYSRPLAGKSMQVKFLTAGQILWHYFKLLVYPMNLTTDYSSPMMDVLTKLNFQATAAWVIAILFIVLAIILYKKEKLMSFSILFFFMTISLVLNIITPLATIMGERFLYLPSVGFCIFTACILYKIHEKKWGRDLSVILIILVGIVFSIIVYRHNFNWKDEMAIFSHAVKVAPRASKARVNLGNTFEKRGLYDDAIKQYEEALRLCPGYAEAFQGLANCYSKLGNFDRAIYFYNETIKSEAGWGASYNNLGLCYMQTGRFKEAAECFSRALSFEPDKGVIYYNIALCYELSKDYKSAIRFYQSMLDVIIPSSQAYFKVEEAKNKIQKFQQAVK